jgi:hypothetical protein
MYLFAIKGYSGHKIHSYRYADTIEELSQLINKNLNDLYTEVLKARDSREQKLTPEDFMTWITGRATTGDRRVLGDFKIYQIFKDQKPKKITLYTTSMEVNNNSFTVGIEQ